MRLRLIAFAAAATLMTGAPALAQSHDHGSAAPAGHGHAHADFQSGRFHVRVDGPENPIGDVILIPGLSSSPHVWDGLTETLKGRYRVHRIHVQGFAGAPAMYNASGGNFSMLTAWGDEQWAAARAAIEATNAKDKAQRTV